MITVIFFGNSPESAQLLFGLIQNSHYQIRSVITKEDTEVAKTARFFGIEVIIATNKWGLQKLFYKRRWKKPDFILVYDYGIIIPKEYLRLPLLEAINIHPSLLPKYRGPSPIQSAIINGDKETGFSVIRVSEQVDAGDIFFQEKIELRDHYTTGDVKKIITEMATNYIQILLFKLKAQSQDISH